VGQWTDYQLIVRGGYCGATEEEGQRRVLGNHGTNQYSGGRDNRITSTNSHRGTAKAYIEARLLRDRLDLYAQVKAKEIANLPHAGHGSNQYKSAEITNVTSVNGSSSPKSRAAVAKV
jgi:hypothetical protein